MNMAAGGDNIFLLLLCKAYNINAHISAPFVLYPNLFCIEHITVKRALSTDLMHKKLIDNSWRDTIIKVHFKFRKGLKHEY